MINFFKNLFGLSESITESKGTYIPSPIAKAPPAVKREPAFNKEEEERRIPHISETGIRLIQEREGFRSKAYKDSAGIWTVGYGTIEIDGLPVNKNTVITIEEANKQLLHFIANAWCSMTVWVKVPLTQYQLDALVSFVYNIGVEAFKKSTVLKLINQSKFDQAAKSILQWKYITVVVDGKKIKKVEPGLLKRRIMESAQFENKLFSLIK